MRTNLTRALSVFEDSNFYADTPSRVLTTFAMRAVRTESLMHELSAWRIQPATQQEEETFQHALVCAMSDFLGPDNFDRLMRASEFSCCRP